MIAVLLVLAVSAIVIHIFHYRLKKEKELCKKYRGQVEYYRTRDSLTGQRSLSFLSENFDIAKKDYEGGVMVKVFFKETAIDKDDILCGTANILSCACHGEVCRTGYDTFVVLCSDCCQTSVKLCRYLNTAFEDEANFAVSAAKFSVHDDTTAKFIKRLDGGVAAAVALGMKRAVY